MSAKCRAAEGRSPPNRIRPELIPSAHFKCAGEPVARKTGFRACHLGLCWFVCGNCTSSRTAAVAV